MKHVAQAKVEKVLSSKIAVLLTGPSGCGKSTILKEAAQAANVPYMFLAGNRQVSTNTILGFMSISGSYVPSTFRKAYEEGAYFNIDECDAMDPNVMLIFNSLENDIVAFPDGYSKPPHKDFRFMATANPQNQHNMYTGRSKLDFATLDRFYEIEIELDKKLELALTSREVAEDIETARVFFKNHGVSKPVTMRDAIRVNKLSNLGFTTALADVLFTHDKAMLEDFNNLMTSKAEERERAREENAYDKLGQNEMTNFNDFKAKVKKG